MWHTSVPVYQARSTYIDIIKHILCYNRYLTVNPRCTTHGKVGSWKCVKQPEYNPIHGLLQVSIVRHADIYQFFCTKESRNIPCCFNPFCLKDSVSSPKKAPKMNISGNFKPILSPKNSGNSRDFPWDFPGFVHGFSIRRSKNIAAARPFRSARRFAAARSFSLALRCSSSCRWIFSMAFTSGIASGITLE